MLLISVPGKFYNSGIWLLNVIVTTEDVRCSMLDLNSFSRLSPSTSSDSYLFDLLLFISFDWFVFVPLCDSVKCTFYSFSLAGWAWLWRCKAKHGWYDHFCEFIFFSFSLFSLFFPFDSQPYLKGMFYEVHHFLLMNTLMRSKILSPRHSWLFLDGLSLNWF